MKRTVIIEAISLLFILLFIYAGISKLLDVQKFRIEIGQSPILTSVSGFVALFIPVTEVAVSVLLAVPKFRLTGLMSSFALMVMFTLYIIAILQFSDNIPCSCGGVLQSLGWTEHLIFNVSFIALAVAGVFLEADRRRTIVHETNLC